MLVLAPFSFLDSVRLLLHSSTCPTVTQLAMTDNTSDTASVTQDTPRICSLCNFPLWSTEERLSDENEISLESFAQVSASAENGCHGCKLFIHAWEHAIPEADRREQSSLNFNQSGENLWVHVFADKRVHNIEVFTLYGTQLHFRITQYFLIKT